MAKWSELIAKIMGDNDTIPEDTSLPPKSTSSESEVPEVISSPSTEVISSSSHESNGITQEMFDALKAEIASLKQANQRLVTRGTTRDSDSDMSDDEIILDLCVGRKKDGTKFESNSSSATES